MAGIEIDEGIAEAFEQLAQGDDPRAEAKRRLGHDNSLIVSPAEKYYGNYGNFSVQQMRKSMLTKGFRRNAKGPKSMPYALNYVKPNKDDSTVVLMGAAEALEEKMRGERGARWTLEVVVSLSAVERRRVMSYALFSPEYRRFDIDALRNTDELRQFQGDHKGKQSVQGRLVQQGHRLLAEGELIDSGALPAQARDLNVTVDGALRVIEDACRSGGDAVAGSVRGNPMIRLQFENKAGVICSLDDLDKESVRVFVKQWMQDMVDFTSGRGRYREWDPVSRSYVMRSRQYFEDKRKSVEEYREYFHRS
jgi:hypothetical protein